MPIGVYLRTEAHKSALKARDHSWLIGNKHGLGNQHNRGKKASAETRQKMSFAKAGKTSPRKGVELSEVTKIKISECKKGVSIKSKGIPRPKMCGINHPRWVVNRTKLKIENRRDDPYHCTWRSSVYKRDRYQCRLKNNHCFGRIEAHHILRYSEHPHIRYEVNNGITLCHYHHPRKKVDEDEKVELFQILIKTPPCQSTP